MAISDPAQTIDPQRQRRAQIYARIRRRLLLVNLASGTTYLVAWLTLGWARSLRDALNHTDIGGMLNFQPHWSLQLILFVILFGLPWRLLDFPLSYYAGYHLPHRFGLSTQTHQGWISDRLKGAMISALLGTPLLLGLFALLRSAPATWWLWGAAGYAIFGIILTALAPVLLMPIFYKFKPLSDEYAELEQRLLKLSKLAGTRVQGVYAFDMSRRTRAANAALAGLGRSRRIILGDTLLEHFSAEEIETILAHELAHQVHKDIPLGILLQVPVTFLFFYATHLMLGWAIPILGLEGLSDPASLPLLGLSFAALGLISMPLSNAWSRWRERMADSYALDLTRKPAAFISAMTRLANQNLAEVEPEAWVVWLLHSHPPLSQRIQRAQRWAASEG